MHSFFSVVFAVLSIVLFVMVIIAVRVFIKVSPYGIKFQKGRYSGYLLALYLI